LDARNYDCLVVPGGFGAAKNLSNFAFEGEKMEVDPEVARVLNDFYTNKKIIGLTCISPVLAAKVFQGETLSMTMGGIKGDNWPYANASVVAKGFGHRM
jgi:enhancing lycopene biosynthesis protein 2